MRPWVALPLGALLGLSFALLSRERPPEWTIVVRADPAQGMNLAALGWSPQRAVVGVTREGPQRVVLRVRGDVPALRLSHPEGCPAQALRASPETVLLHGWIEAPARVSSVGFDAPFALTVRAGCSEAVAGTISWRLRDGAVLSAMETADGGFTLRARTGPMESSELPAWGIVPVSAAAQRRSTLELTWRGQAHPPVTRTLEVTAAPRASAVPSVGVSHAVYLAGSGWRVSEHPAGARALLDPSGTLTRFVPELGGRYDLTDGSGRALHLDASRLDEVRLDCGRSECHATVAREVLRSPMSSLGARSLNPGCAVGCHSMGEAGLDDGGFEHVARELGRPATPSAPSVPWNELPRDLRRVSSVGCEACHGPAALPPREARWLVLQSAVCAVCHDAPERYGHSAALRRSRMALSDQAAGVGERPACRRCHSVDGFLRALSVPATLTHPEGASGLGVTCSTCHAPHSQNSGRALVRAAPWPVSLGPETLAAGSSSRVCLSCHAPVQGLAPAASAALTWLGRGALSVANGSPITSPAPHAAVPGGCLGCHGSASRDHGEGHDFRATPARCLSCHPAGAPAEPTDSQGRGFRARVEALRVRWAVSPFGHASSPDDETSTPSGRARHDLGILTEDPAAWVHGGRFSLSVLTELEAFASLSSP